MGHLGPQWLMGMEWVMAQCVWCGVCSVVWAVVGTPWWGVGTVGTTGSV